jgi:geranylgeranyl reductase family protein
MCEDLAVPRAEWDAIVVGAGPAGGIAAYELARSGRSVLLIDRDTLPRYKPCGGGVTRKALRLLPFDLAPLAERDISRATIAFRRDRIDVDACDMGLMVMRPTFDHAIARAAVEAGATLVERARVTAVVHHDRGADVETSAGTFRGRAIIGADGTESVVARSFPDADALETGVAIEAETVPWPGVSDERVLFDFAAIPGGYGYVFPKASHLSVGLYTTNGSARGMRAALDAYTRSGRIPEVSGFQSIVGHRVPLRLRRRLAHGTSVLAGDAAGAADPVWGEGIFYALRSGVIAAETAAAALATDLRKLSSYPAALHDAIGRDLRWARWVARLLYALPEAALIRLVRDTGSLRAMIGILRGDTTYRAFARQLAVSQTFLRRLSTDRA